MLSAEQVGRYRWDGCLLPVPALSADAAPGRSVW